MKLIATDCCILLTGGATMTFTAPGVHTYQCILVDPETDKPHTELGMIGTFEVDERLRIPRWSAGAVR